MDGLVGCTDDALRVKLAIIATDIMLGPKSVQEQGIIRPDYIVRVITDGGRLEMVDLQKLLDHIDEKMVEKYPSKEWSRITTEINFFRNGIKQSQNISIARHTRAELLDLTIFIAEYLAKKQPKIIY